MTQSREIQTVKGNLDWCLRSQDKKDQPFSGWRKGASAKWGWQTSTEILFRYAITVILRGFAFVLLFFKTLLQCQQFAWIASYSFHLHDFWRHLMRHFEVCLKTKQNQKNKKQPPWHDIKSFSWNYNLQDYSSALCCFNTVLSLD